MAGGAVAGTRGERGADAAPPPRRLLAPDGACTKRLHQIVTHEISVFHWESLVLESYEF